MIKQHGTLVAASNESVGEKIEGVLDYLKTTTAMFQESISVMSLSVDKSTAVAERSAAIAERNAALAAKKTELEIAKEYGTEEEADGIRAELKALAQSFSK